ncbi:MAG TPA: SRPBCC domain-containing protein, partial [Tepidisphaeraceae bacterium]|nr:SRPBCC domain-containing protein [Tepidisphaeraceae bacterium]
MKHSGKLKITTQGDLEIVMVREFDAHRDMVFDGLTKPELVRQWLLGPEGWSMVVCDIDLKVGGKYRYEWRHTNGKEMGMEGVYREVNRPERLAHTEKFDQPWYPGEAVITTVLAERGGKTVFTATMVYESRDA